MSFAFSKTTPATGAQAIYEWKEQLKAQGWSVTESSDGTTYGAGDNISSGGTGANGMENDLAWFTIQSPNGSGFDEFSVQRQASGNTDWRWKHSRTSGFTGGSPSATQVSSAADEQVIYGSGTDASPTMATLFATDGTYRWNVGADNAGQYGWWAGAFPTGGGNPTTGIVFDPLAAYEPTDAYLKAIYISGTNPFQDSQISTESFSTSSNALWSLVASTSPTTYAFMTGYVLYSLAATETAIPNGLPTNPISVKDEVFPIVLGRRGAQTNPGFKGLTSLMKWTGTSRSTGDTLTVSGTRDRIVYRSVSLPWDGTVPSV